MHDFFFVFSSVFLPFLLLKLPCELQNVIKLHIKLRNDEMSSTGRTNSLEFWHFCSLIDGTVWALSGMAMPNIFALNL